MNKFNLAFLLAMTIGGVSNISSMFMQGLGDLDLSMGDSVGFYNHEDIPQGVEEEEYIEEQEEERISLNAEKREAARKARYAREDEEDRERGVQPIREGFTALCSELVSPLSQRKHVSGDDEKKSKKTRHQLRQEVIEQNRRYEEMPARLNQRVKNGSPGSNAPSTDTDNDRAELLEQNDINERMNRYLEYQERKKRLNARNRNQDDGEKEAEGTRVVNNENDADLKRSQSFEDLNDVIRENKKGHQRTASAEEFYQRAIREAQFASKVVDRYEKDRRSQQNAQLGNLDRDENRTVERAEVDAPQVDVRAADQENPAIVPNDGQIQNVQDNEDIQVVGRPDANAHLNLDQETGAGADDEEEEIIPTGRPTPGGTSWFGGLANYVYERLTGSNSVVSANTLAGDGEDDQEIEILPTQSTFSKNKGIILGGTAALIATVATIITIKSMSDDKDENKVEDILDPQDEPDTVDAPIPAELQDAFAEVLDMLNPKEREALEQELGRKLSSVLSDQDQGDNKYRNQYAQCKIFDKPLRDLGNMLELNIDEKNDLRKSLTNSVDQETNMLDFTFAEFAAMLNTIVEGKKKFYTLKVDENDINLLAEVVIAKFIENYQEKLAKELNEEIN